MCFFRDEITPAEEKWEVLCFVKTKCLEDFPSLPKVHITESKEIPR